MFGTLQDRLIKELRLEKINNKQEANKFLEEIFIPKFNKKFSVLPVQKINLHKALTEIDKTNLDKIFSEQNIRTVNNDFTVRFKGRWLQLAERQPTLVLRKDKVLIEERIDENIFLSLRDKYLSYEILPERPKKIKMKVAGLTRERPYWKPPADHPWRRQFIFSRPKVEKKIVFA